MIEEPAIQPDDTSPRQPTRIDETLRRDEPPVTDEDTNPRRPVRLEDRLRAEEPPVSGDDTSPSLVTRALVGDLGVKPQTNPAQRLVAFAMLLGALLLTVAAGLIWMSAGDTPGDTPNAGTSLPTAIAAIGTPTTQPAPTATPEAAPTQDSGDTALPTTQFGFPTAAADEIAVALLTPVPDKPLAGAALRQSAPFTLRSAKSSASVVNYTVQQGDTLDSIANRFGLSSYWPIVWSNSRSKYSTLRPGTQLMIPPDGSIYYEVTEPITIAQVAEQYKVSPYAIIDSEYNADLFGTTPETLLVPGMRIVIPGGEGEKVNLMAANPNASGGGSNSVSGTYNLWGCTSNIQGGSLPTTRPLDGYQFMRGLVPGHDGVDLSADIGDPVYASGSGTVAFSGWNSYGFGYVVVIAHGPIFSIYGHLSRLNVSCGGYVEAGQVIGYSGNSGNSTGPHLHFELRDANWNVINPMAYIGF